MLGLYMHEYDAYMYVHSVSSCDTCQLRLALSIA